MNNNKDIDRMLKTSLNDILPNSSDLQTFTDNS